MDIGFHSLEGRFVRMEPLMPEHKEEIRAAIDCDPASWSIMLVNPVGAGFDEYWSASCGASPTERLPYAIRRLSDGRSGRDVDLLHGVGKARWCGDRGDIPASRCACEPGQP